MTVQSKQFRNALVTVRPNNHAMNILSFNDLCRFKVKIQDLENLLQ